MGNFKTSIISFSVFVLLLTISLISVVYLRKGNEKDMAKRQVFSRNPTSIKSFEIDRMRSQIHFTRISPPKTAGDQGEWEISVPKHVPVDKDEITYLLDKIPNLKAKRIVVVGSENNPANLKQFGLDEAQLRIIMNGDGFRDELQIGSSSKVNHDYYVKKKNNLTVYLVERHIVERLSRQLYSFRKKRIADFYPDQIQQITVETAEFTWSAKKTNDQWFLSFEEQTLPADENRIVSLIEGIRNLDIDEFIADHITSKEVQEFGLDKPDIQVIFRDDTETEHGLLISKPFARSERVQQVHVMKPNGQFIYAENSGFTNRLRANPKDFTADGAPEEE